MDNDGILDDLAMAVTRAGPDGTILWANRAMLELLGYAGHECVGRPIATFLADEAVSADIFAHILRREAVANLEARLRSKDGTPRHVLLTAHPRWQNGALVDVLIFACDITERKTREAELERGNRALEALSEISRTLGEPGFDLGHTLCALGRHMTALLGDACAIRLLSRDKKWLVIGSVHHRDGSAHDMMTSRPMAPMPADQGFTATVIRTGKPVLIPIVEPHALAASVPNALRDYPEVFPVHSLLIVPISGGGAVLGTITLWRHTPGRPYTPSEEKLVTELADGAGLAIIGAEQHRELRARTMQLYEAVRVRDEFLSVASHELRTPLMTVELYLGSVAHSLRGGGLGNVAPTELATRIGKGLDQLHRVSKLVEEMLDVSRIAGGRLALKPEPFDLGSLAEEVASRFQDHPENAGSPIVVTTESGIVGKWDKSRVDQVITNLISNAVKYGAKKAVQIAVSKADGAARLMVADQGAGIAAEDRGRIFDRFERAAPMENVRGLGLGLWLSKQIVSAHGGRIDVTSTLGVGSTFTVDLPMTCGAAAEGQVA